MNVPVLGWSECRHTYTLNEYHNERAWRMEIAGWSIDIDSSFPMLCACLDKTIR